MIADDVQLGQNVTIPHPDLVNLYGCEIGDGCKIGAFVEIRKQVCIGRNVKIQAFAFIPEGVTIEDGADCVLISVTDDGDGFDPSMRMHGKSCLVVIGIRRRKVIEQQEWI